MSGRSVFVTGAAGLVGSVVVAGLDERFDVHGADIRRRARSTSDRPVRRADLRAPRVARRALGGADVVVHLAVGASMNERWRAVLDTNARLTWSVLEAAASTGVRRVVLASSNHVVGGYEQLSPYREIVGGERAGLQPADVPRLTADVAVRPDGAYAVGKVMDEAVGRHFADAGDLSVIALRIGTVRPDDRPGGVRHLSTLLTHRDLIHLVERCIEAPDDLRFATYYGVSANTWRIWDIDAAREAIGYEPRDDAEVWRSTLGRR